MAKKEKILKQKRVRAKMFRIVRNPRLTVFRSNKKIYAQIIDDGKGITLVSLSGVGTVKGATEIGEKIAALAKAKKVTKVVFDRGSYKYHGQVQALAEGARKGGLIF